MNAKGVRKVHVNLAGLLVAMAITAVLALSLLPLAITTHGAMAVERGAEELARELQAARQLAVANNDTYQVFFDRTAKTYFIMPSDAFSPSRCIQLPAGVEWVKLSTNPIYFHGTGKCPTGGTISVRHQSSGYQVEVVVATHSGRVRLERKNP
jgi:Tfp pilus assembly protein FimT